MKVGAGTRRFKTSVLAALLLFGLAACYREASDASAPGQARYTGNAPWSIDGVRPGQTFAEVKLVLGEPRDAIDSMGQRVVRWSSPRDISVTFGRAGLATDILGTSLKAGNATLVWSSASEAEVVQILGPGAVRKSYRPTGSGVISLGREHTGTTLVYDHAGVRFELTVFGEAAGHFRAYRQP